MASRILVIDDNAGIVEIIRRALEMAGHEVKTSLHGRDTLELFDSFDPQLIITDIILPDTDSIDTIVECRKRKPQTKIIAISGNGHLLSVAEKHGVDHILPKPFGPGQINALVASALN
ncbi:MAG TPA: response regulator [Rhizomicrobium sp.]|nr:response regulator [Rhizomicrobium sp.]